MGSVIDYIECPNCEQEAYSDFYYKTGEEYVYCANCGYHYSATLDEDDFEIIELKNPYGSYQIKYYDSGHIARGSLENKRHFNGFKLQCEKDDTIESCTVSRFVDGEIKVETIIDNGPQTDSAGFTAKDR